MEVTTGNQKGTNRANTEVIVSWIFGVQQVDDLILYQPPVLSQLFISIKYTQQLLSGGTEKWNCSISLWNAVRFLSLDMLGFLHSVWTLGSEDFLDCLDFVFAWGGCGYSGTKIHTWTSDLETTKASVDSFWFHAKRLGNFWSLLIQL